MIKGGELRTDTIRRISSVPIKEGCIQKGTNVNLVRGRFGGGTRSVFGEFVRTFGLVEVRVELRVRFEGGFLLFHGG